MAAGRRERGEQTAVGVASGFPPGLDSGGRTGPRIWLDLGMTDWSQLSHAHGSAENIPPLLDQLEPDPAAECWEELWAQLCPEGTVHPASFAALPRLTAVAAEWPPEDRGLILALAGAIMAGTRGSSEFGDMPRRHAGDVSTLLKLTEESLRSPALSDDPHTFLYLLQAMLAFEGVPVWDERLEGLADEEYEVDCPGCGVSLFIAMGEYGFFASAGDYATDEDAPRTPLVPSDPDRLEGVAKRLHTIAEEAGQDKVSTGLTHLFGAATCTACGETFPVADRVAAA
jgi:hypothetical protein